MWNKFNTSFPARKLRMNFAMGFAEKSDASKYFASRWLRMFSWVILAGAWLIQGGLSFAAPQENELFVDPRPIIDREPYFRLTFTNDQSVLIDPIDIAKAKKIPTIGSLVFELMAEPSSEYKYVVKWRNVSKVETFGQIVLQEANRLRKAGKITESIRYFMFLKNHPMFDGDRPEMDFFPILLLDTKQTLRSRDYVAALACFQELKRSYPARFLNINQQVKTSDDGLRFCYEKILQDELKKKLYVVVRRRIAHMNLLYPKITKELYDQYIEKMRDEARKGLSRLRGAIASGKPLLAQDALRDMLAIAPDLPEAQELKKQIHDKFPMIMVGVNQHGTTSDPRKIEDWAARRVGQIIRRSVVEFQRQDDDGGIYDCPIGRIEAVGDDGVELRLDLNQNNSEKSVPDISAVDIAFVLENAVNPESSSFHPLWARVLDSVEVENPTSVTIRLRYPFLIPKSLLQHTFANVESAKSDGPLQFDFEDKGSARRVFKPNTMFRTETNQPSVVENKIPDTSKATRMLIEGGLDVIDQVHPGELNRLKANPDIVVRRYQIPSVHWLVPNFRNDWVSNPVFRRALLYGIDRKRIVEDVLTGGKDVDGYDVISGPFPVGMSETDPLMYANNFRLRPLPFNRDLSRVFLKMSAKQVKGMQERRARLSGQAPPSLPKAAPQNVDITDPNAKVKEEEEVLPEPPEIVLAYPGNLQAHSICTLIQQQWKTIGVKTKLVRLKDGEVIPKDNDYDFVFVEITMQEPLVDARRIFGRHGIVKTVDANVEQSLNYIDQVKNWQAAGSGLRRLHTQVYNKLSILPLWQVPQYYAHRPNVRNMGFEINSLYQNVGNWRYDIDAGKPNATAKKEKP